MIIAVLVIFYISCGAGLIWGVACGFDELLSYLALGPHRKELCDDAKQLLNSTFRVENDILYNMGCAVIITKMNKIFPISEPDYVVVSIYNEKSYRISKSCDQYKRIRTLLPK